MEIQEEINQIEKKISEAKTERDKNEGIISSLKERLEKEFGFKDIKSAQEHLKQLELEISHESELLTASLKSLKERFVWK